MSGIQQLLLGGSPAGYQIERSLRFNSADSAYLNRTPTSAGNRKTWTWSGWVKRSALSSNFGVLEGNAGAGQITSIRIASDNTLSIQDYTDPTLNLVWSTNAVFRDVSAWYHFVFVFDTTQASSANAVKIYVNGVQQTVTFLAATGAYTQNREGYINATNVQRIGTYNGLANYLNGYLAEVNFIDGQALTPSDFGETDSATGVWKPKKFSGTYGTNGFYLNFSDNSNTTAATLGKDYSGNGNNWTPNNFSVTAGTGNDSLVDTPTSYGTDTGVGGEVRGNYCTWNPLKQVASGITASNGNLDTVNTLDAKILGTIGMSSGKWYWEVTPTANGGNASIGIATDATSLASSSEVGQDANSWGYLGIGSKYNNGSVSAYGASYTNNDVIGVAFDADAGTLVFYKNNSSQGTAFSSLTSGPYFPAIGNSNASASANFGQRPFSYTAPSGFKALCTQNLPTPTIGATSTTQANKYFDIQLYTGTGSSRSVTGYNFQPEFVWIKGRSGATNHGLYDAVRGVQLQLESNTTAAETTQSTGLTAFNTDGFTVGSLAQLNTNTATYVAWAWDAAGSNSTNTSGTITSTVRANTTAGFSIVTYTGTGANATVGHGLGVAPKMVIVKNRDEVYDWPVYHISIGNTNYVYLNTTSASAAASSLWNNTTPTSTVFSIGTSGAVNNSTKKYVAYCFAEVAGYSAFGSYTGNGSTDGPFVYTGFRPRWLMVKRSDSGAESWYVTDSARGTYNLITPYLTANESNQEFTANMQDFLSNGFKIRGSGTYENASGGTYIYAAFAESPFKYSLAR